MRQNMCLFLGVLGYLTLLAAGLFKKPCLVVVARFILDKLKTFFCKTFFFSPGRNEIT